MLSLSGSGLLRDVHSEPTDDPEMVGVSILLDAHDVGLPDAGTATVLLHWFCGEEESAVWLELARWDPPPRVWFSGMGPLIEGEHVSVPRVDGALFDLVARMVALDAMVVRRGEATGGA
ncbi:hypothetical protein Bra3105_11670 [Brachybacterium halotolerans subsp. kimchii]|uniref:hypothetical protein n=1 Tax=Brachybacterium halotolerans TaxID=2795215 RepID=UPI001E41C9CA|nr:hypothetical protein [Brachybacterium halotolerans]UEJ81499.1 hypothetical protein Bra3105_11670 [Brachybacterium halotolerans subsp. kimchii]